MKSSKACTKLNFLAVDLTAYSVGYKNGCISKEVAIRIVCNALFWSPIFANLVEADPCPINLQQ